MLLNKLKRGNNMIKLFRIDDRLIHGQVAFAWTRATGTDHIIVVDDNAYNDQMQKSILRLGKPANTKLTIVPVSKFKKAYSKYKNSNLMIITSSIGYAKEVIKQVPSAEITEINLGGVRPGEGRKRIGNAVYLSAKELSDLNEIVDTGFDVIIQETPTSNKIKYTKIGE